MRNVFVLSVLLALAMREAVAAPASAQVLNLPYLAANINFDQYSGYINVNQKENRNIFYWFVESQSAPATDPLILWLQGGPGCSGLFGLVSENGPFTLQNNGSLTLNPYSWNTNANIIYIESPVGVGFSFTTDSILTNSDNQTMEDSYNFLQGWFQQYPEYAYNDFYVAGESYGGHYVPQLSFTILENNANPGNNNLKINLQGMLIGNAWTDIFYDSWSVPPFVYFHSLCSYQTYELVVANCIDNNSLDLTEPFSDYKPRVLRGAEEDCGQALQQMYDEMGPINNYDIYTPCYGGLQDDCTDNTVIQDYFNDDAVQLALHVETSGKTNYTWTSCDDVNYTDSWRSVLPLYPMLMDSIHVVVYSGDVTYNVPAIGTQTWVDDFQQPLLVPWTAWYLEDQVAGYYKKYDRITYVTVLGSGHMVPMYTPAAAKELLNAYFNNTF